MKPATTFTALRTPLLNADGTMTWTWQQWFIDIQNRVQNSLNEQGQFNGNISASATVGNRPEPLSTDIQNIDGNGVITANGIDFTRAYLNKNTDNIGDGTGHPLAGGKEAYSALVSSSPTAGELLGYDGTEWLPQQKAHTITKIPHQWIDSYSDITGNFTQSQPNYSDIAGTPTLPANTPSTLHQWINSYNSTTGAFSQSQPAFSDISGTVAASQIPAPTSSTLGGTKSAGPTSHQWINAIDTTGTPQLSQPSAADMSNGVTGSGSVVLATSPTLSTPINLSGSDPLQQMGAGINGSSISYGINSGAANVAVVIGGNGCYIKHNNYFNGTNDLFINAATAYQMVLGSSGLQVRKSTNSPTAGGIITWGAFTTLFS